MDMSFGYVLNMSFGYDLDISLDMSFGYVNGYVFWLEILGD